jgi:hypothetical protein
MLTPEQANRSDDQTFQCAYPKYSGQRALNPLSAEHARSPVRCMPRGFRASEQNADGALSSAVDPTQEQGLRRTRMPGLQAVRLR